MPPVVVAIYVGGGLLTGVLYVVGKIAWDENNRRTMETKAKCCCLMKEAGLSEEFVRDFLKSCDSLHENDMADLMTLVECLISEPVSPEDLKRIFEKFMYRKRSRKRRDRD